MGPDPLEEMFNAFPATGGPSGTGEVPDRGPVTAWSLREAIAAELEKISANEVADECVKLGLEPPGGGNDDPWKGKYRYVERRLRHWDLPDLIAFAHKVDAVFDSPSLQDMIVGVPASGEWPAR